MPKRKKSNTEIMCSEEDCNFNNNDIGNCIHNRPDLWLYKDIDGLIDWKCSSYTFNILYGLSDKEVKEYRVTKVKTEYAKKEYTEKLSELNNKNRVKYI